MNLPTLPIITHSWSISGTVPNPDQKYPNYGCNFHIGITAPDMESALQTAREIYPNAKFQSCNSRGPIHGIAKP